MRTYSRTVIGVNTAGRSARARQYTKGILDVVQAMTAARFTVAALGCLLLACSTSGGPTGSAPAAPEVSSPAPQNGGPSADTLRWLAGDHTIRSPADLARLAGGAASPFALAGDLIVESVIVAELAPLDALQQIAGDLIIRQNPALTQIPLGGLRRLGGDLVIRDNPSLASARGLSGLRRIDGHLVLASNGWTRLEGLDALDRLAGDLRILGHDRLRRVDGLSRLVRLQGDLEIRDNRAATLRFTGLQRLARIDGRVQIEAGHLDTLAGLAALLSIGGDLNVVDTQIAVLAGFEQLGLVQGDVNLTGNDSLVSLATFDNLTEIGGLLRLQGDHRLEQVRFEALGRVEGGVAIEDNLRLESVAFPALEQAGSITLAGSADRAWTSLIDLDGLGALRTIQGDLILQFNDLLEDIQGLVKLTRLEGQQARFVNKRQPLDQIADLVEQLRDHGFEGDVQIIGGFTGLPSEVPSVSPR